jgi:pimeloyl-ACP methyl ester carboxylesterase
MYRDVVPTDSTAEEWKILRGRIHARILATMGTTPRFCEQMNVHEGSPETLEGLIRIPIRFQILPEWEVLGSWLIPQDLKPGAHPGVLCMHGTDRQFAHRGMMNVAEKPERVYAIELAKRGFVTLSVDQFGFGEGCDGRSVEEIAEWFYTTYPEGSLDGLRLDIHRRAVDLLTGHEAVETSRIGCIGYSLGGRAALYLAAFDPRVRACVTSTGLSPNLTNVYRNPVGAQALSPLLNQQMAACGRPLFEYQELVALVAPRGLLIVEPWNDPYNPSIEAVFRCVEKARFAFEMEGASEKMQLLSHGHEHNTPRYLRSNFYNWLEEML